MVFSHTGYDGEDPNDLLNSGIDVDVQPPGKAVKSIKLLFCD